MGSLLLQHKRSAKSLVSMQVMGLGTGARESGKDFWHWKMMLEMIMVMQVMMRRGLFVSGEAGGPLAIPSAPLAQLLTHLPGKRVLLGPARVSLTSVQQPPRGAFSVAWPYTLSLSLSHTHTHTHTTHTHPPTHIHIHTPTHPHTPTHTHTHTHTHTPHPPCQMS